ncbi:MAG: aconitase family protein, partial [Phycisphaeraceae bacterium]
MESPKNIIQKIWDDHVVLDGTGGEPDVLYIDTHLVHEVTSPQAFAELRQRGLRVRAPGRTFATLDHAIPTTEPGADGRWEGLKGAAALQVQTLEEHCATHGIELCGRDHPSRGIIHVVAGELGLVRPGA